MLTLLTRLRYTYNGLDGVTRITELDLSPAAWQLSADRAAVEVELQPGEEAQLALEVRCQVSNSAVNTGGLASGLSALRATRRTYVDSFAHISSNNESFNDWIRGSVRDIAILCTRRPTGPYIYAGIPWFATIFGRDALVTATEALAFAPSLAAGVLRGLAALQGRKHDPAHEEEPARFYMSCARVKWRPPARSRSPAITAASTPRRFFCACWRPTGSGPPIDLIRELWPSVLAASEWIDQHLDARGYLAYERLMPTGFVNQAWKDSHDAISHADGTLADAPTALCEVQAYVYAARQGLSAVAHHLRYTDKAEMWSTQAAELSERFERDFWLPEQACYALALDCDSRPCRVIASNAGHCLYAGIATPGHAVQVVRSAHGGRELLGLGCAHTGVERASIQPDELSQRVGVAT